MGNDNFYIAEAFQSLQLLEDDFDLTADRGVVDELQSFVADDIEAPVEEVVIDTEAVGADELQDSYVGKVILECDCCHARIYKDAADVVIDEETGKANIEEMCPVCNGDFGWNIIGKIEPFEEVEEVEEEPEEVEVETEISDDEIQEALNETIGDKKINESMPLREDVEQVKELVSGWLYDHLLDLNDNLAQQLHYEIPEYDVDWCNEDGMSEVSERVGEDMDQYVGSLVDLLFFNAPRVESLGEALNESQSDLNADVYNALADVAFENEQKGEVNTKDGFEKAETNFNDKFFDESLTEAEDEESIGKKNAEKFLAYLKENDCENTGPFDEEEVEIQHDYNGSYSIHLESQAGEDLFSFYDDGSVKVNGMYDDGETEEHHDHVFNSYAEFVQWYKDNNIAWTSDLGSNLTEECEDEKELEEKCDESLTEDLDKVEVCTDEGCVEVAKDGDKVVVDLDPHEDEEVKEEPEAEMIAPLTDEEQVELSNNDEVEIEDSEEPVEEVEDDFDIEDFDEESFDDLGESYLKKVYDNIKSFKTTSVKKNGSSLVVESLITFKSGKERPVSFIFEDHRYTKNGKLVLEGRNELFSKSNKSFVLKGLLNDKKYVSESLIYNYTVKNLNEANESELLKVHGRVVRR